MVLRLTALRSLQFYIEDPEFAVQGLVPVLGPRPRSARGRTQRPQP
eukprot:gene14465-1286_t